MRSKTLLLLAAKRVVWSTIPNRSETRNMYHRRLIRVCKAALEHYWYRLITQHWHRFYLTGYKQRFRKVLKIFIKYFRILFERNYADLEYRNIVAQKKTLEGRASSHLEGFIQEKAMFSHVIIGYIVQRPNHHWTIKADRNADTNTPRRV